MDIKKILVVAMLFVFILAAGFLVIFHKEYFSPLTTWVFPGSVLISVRNVNDTTFVEYESYGGVQDFYALRLQLLGWTKTAELGREDWTLCGGDWGGTYEKDNIRFKLHVCGPNNGNTLKTIRFEFYNITPNVVLGSDFTSRTGNCEDSKIEILSACYAKDELRIKIKRKNPRDLPIGIGFQVYIRGVGYYNSKDIEVTWDTFGIGEMDIIYDPNKYGKIRGVEMTPIVFYEGASYHCLEQRISSEVIKCGDPD